MPALVCHTALAIMQHADHLQRSRMLISWPLVPCMQTDEWPELLGTGHNRGARWQLLYLASAPLLLLLSDLALLHADFASCAVCVGLWVAVTDVVLSACACRPQSLHALCFAMQSDACLWPLQWNVLYDQTGALGMINQNLSVIWRSAC